MAPRKPETVDYMDPETWNRDDPMYHDPVQRHTRPPRTSAEVHASLAQARRRSEDLIAMAWNVNSLLPDGLIRARGFGMGSADLHAREAEQHMDGIRDHLIGLLRALGHLENPTTWNGPRVRLRE